MDYFCLQVSNPQLLRRCPETEESIAGAIESIFTMETEDAYMKWKGVDISLNYKYDVAYMIEDVIEILSALSAAPHGQLEVNWASDTFSSTWRLTWQADDLAIDADWRSLAGNIEAAVAKAGPLKVSVRDFASEWAELLNLVDEKITASGIVLPATAVRRWKAALAMVKLQSGGQRGRLYRPSSTDGEDQADEADEMDPV